MTGRLIRATLFATTCLTLSACVTDTAEAATKRAPRFSISVAPGSEASKKIIYTITKLDKATSDSIVTFTTVQQTARSGTDYLHMSGQVLFTRSQTVRTVTVIVIDDAVVDPNETLIGRIAASKNATIVTGQVVGTIADNDVVAPPPPPTQECPDGSVIPATQQCPAPPPPPPPTQVCPDGSVIPATQECPITPPPPPPIPASILVSEAACSEGDVCFVPVTRSGGDLSKGATFDWATTTDGTAVPGVDFSPRSGRLVFAPGSPTATSPTFPSIENTIDQPDRTVMVRVSSPDAPVATPQGEIKIMDDDEAPSPPPPPVPCPDGTTVPAGQTCPVPPPPPPSTDVWTFCNHNNFTCFLNGTGKVRWGSKALGDWTVIEPVTGSIECSQEVFRREKPTVGGYHCETNLTPTVFTYTPPAPGTPGWVPMPTPDGEVPINMSEGDLVATSVIAENSAVPDVVGAMRFFCRAGQIQQVDPIVSFGRKSAHWHQFFGWSEMSTTDTFQTLQTKPGYSVCNYPPSAAAGMTHLDVPNHSGYWISAMIVNVPAGSSIPVKTLTLQPGQPTIGGVMTKMTPHFWVPDGNTIYYKGRPSGDPACKGVSPWGPQYLGCVPIRHGLKILFGYDMTKLLDSEAPMTFRCIDAAGVQRGPMGPYIKDALANCPVGGTLHQSIHAPQCHDPKYLDSPNHMDHMSYSYQKLGTGKGGCVPTRSGAYQVEIPPAVTLLTSWTVTQAVVDAVKADPDWGVYLSSDEHLKMLRPKEAWAGRTGHADFLISWLAKVRDRWHFGAVTNGMFYKGCIEGLKNCSAGQTGTGMMQRGGGAPWYPSQGRTIWDHPNNLVPVRDEGYTAEW